MLQQYFDEQAGKVPVKNYLIITMRNTNAVFIGEISKFAFRSTADFQWLVKNNGRENNPEPGPTIECSKSWIGAFVEKIGTLSRTYLTPKTIEIITQPLQKIANASEPLKLTIGQTKNIELCKKCYGLGFRHIDKCTQCRKKANINCSKCQGTGYLEQSAIEKCVIWNKITKQNEPCKYSCNVPDELDDLNYNTRTIKCKNKKCNNGKSTKCKKCFGSGWLEHEHAECFGEGCDDEKCNRGMYYDGPCTQCPSCSHCNGTGIKTIKTRKK